MPLTPVRRAVRARRAAALAVVPVLLLAGCGDDSSEGSEADASASPSASGSASGAPEASGTPTPLGEGLVSVSGAFGEKPVVEVPEGSEAPTEVVTEVIEEGDGDPVEQGDLLLANYLGQVFEPGAAEPNVFDNSYDRGDPAGFAIGVGQVIPGWDEALVGRNAGDRVALVIPAAQAYGAEEDPENELAGQTLVFVVDVVASYGKDAAASGTAATAPAGFPQVTSAPGEQPQITGVEGVEVGEEPTAALLVEGDGDPIDPEATLVYQLVAANADTGEQTESTWEQAPASVPAEQVLPVVPALEGANVGSRAVAVVPGQPAVPGAEGSPEQPPTPPTVFVIDVVGQF